MSVRHDGMSWFLIVAFLFVVGVAAFYVLYPQARPHTSLKVGDGIFSADIIYAGVQPGPHELSKSTSLQDAKARIVVYDRPGLWVVASTNAKSAYDIVWVGENKKVTYIVKNISEKTPSSDYTPREPARYIVELPGGMVEAKAIKVGDTAVFDPYGTEGL